MRRTRTLVACVGTALAALTFGGCAGPVRWQSTLVSHNAAGTNSGNGPSTGPSISADGTKVAFVSEARNLGLPDTNGFADVFVRDTTTGTITLVSVNRMGTNSGNGPSRNPIISADGTKVAFVSSATNLQSLPLTGDRWLYVRDLATGTTTVATVNASGTIGRGLPTFPLVLEDFDFSDDGEKVVFAASDADLVNGYIGAATSQIYIRDLTTATTSLVSVDTTGSQYGNSFSLFPRLRPDGGAVVFSSYATNLVSGSPGTPGTVHSLFARDLTSGTTSYVGPGIGAGFSSAPSNASFSLDGTKVVFEADTPLPGITDANAARDVFVTDLSTGATTLVSERAGGGDAGDGASSEASFSPDGTQVVFTSAASDLVVGDGNEESDVFVCDLAAGMTSLVSARADGAGSAIAGSRRGVFAEDGRVLFESLAWNFGPHDGNNDWDLYLRNLDAGITSLVSARPDGTDSGDEASTTGAYGGGKVAYQSRATGLAGADTNATWDIYLAAPYTPPPPPPPTTEPEPPTTDPPTTRPPPTTAPPTTEPPTTEPPTTEPPPPEI